MQAVQAKPRLSYAAFVAQQVQRPTIGALINRFISEMDGDGERSPVHTLGNSHRWTLKRLRSYPLARIVASTLNEDHIIDFCKSRVNEDRVKPGTVNQDVTYLSGVLKYARAAWKDCKDVSARPIEDVLPFLRRHGLVGKANQRTRRPSPEEIYRLIEYFATPPRRGKKRTLDMVLMTLWQYYSGRRVGESCALLWEDWNREEQTILVRKMKDPKNRAKRKVVALTEEAQALLNALWGIRDPQQPRILPFNAKSVCAAYTHAKKKLGIVDLHLHDSRRDVTSRLLEKGYTSEQAILVTGHEGVGGAFRVYAKPSPATFKNGPRASLALAA